MIKSFKLDFRLPISVVIASILTVTLLPTNTLAVFPGTNGKVLYEKNSNGYSHVYTADPNGSNRVNLTPSNSGMLNYPSWSSDGSKIFYAKGGSTYNSAIYVMESNGTNERRVSSTGIYGPLAPSPDGSSIIAQSDVYECTVLVDIETGAFECIYDDLMHHVTWSPDGTEVAFNPNAPHTSILILNLLTGEISELTNHAGYSWPVDWSSDGSKIAYISTLHPSGNDGSEFRLYTVNSDGTNLNGFDDSIVGRSSIHIYDASFSPDGSKLVYSYHETSSGLTSIRVTDGYEISGPTAVIDTNAMWQSKVDWQSVGSGISSSTPQPLNASVPIERFYSPLVKHHLFTADQNEASYVRGHYPSSIWTYEGTAFKVKAVQGCVDGENVYRFYSEVLKTHLYTMDENEKRHITSTYPPSVWRYEGIAYCAESYPNRESKPVYRLYSEALKTHLYTMDENEASYIIETYDQSVWRFESIAYFAY